MDGGINSRGAQLVGELPIVWTHNGGLIAAPIQIGNEIEKLAFSAAVDRTAQV